MTWLAKGGGVDNNVLQTILGLRDEFEMHLAVGSEIHYNPFERLEGIRFIVCPSLVRKISPWKDLKALTFFYRLIRREKYDIVHTHEAKASFITRIAAWLARCPFIIYGLHGVTFNDPLNPFVRRLYVLIEKYSIGTADFIVSVSRQVIDIYHSEQIGKKTPFLVIHSGINLKPFLQIHENDSSQRTARRKSLGFNDEDIVLVNVGRFSHSKAQRYTIEAFQSLSGNYSKLKLLLVGEGELMEQCKAQVNNAGLSSRVNFYGYSDAIPELIHASDINVLTSLREGLPRVVAEACFCKRPTVAFDVEGLKEIITDGHSGFMVTQCDTAALTEKIKLLIDNSELRTKFGEVGFMHACRYWDAQIMINELRELYLQSRN